ncbi:MAG: hypothetical protein U1E15_00255 [Hyphomicrobiales bacterium]
MASGIDVATPRFQPYINAMLRDLPPAAPHVHRIIYAEPFAMARRLKGAQAPDCTGKRATHEHLVRYSFLACNPASTLRMEGVAHLDGVAQAGR